MILYDSFGGVIANSLPVTLTAPFANLPDAATGLAHVGNGRWYDPATGRPLQPNPVGGPPALPQALNRYAATPLGQPGVYEAAAQQSEILAWVQQQSIKVPVGLAAGKYFFEPLWGDALRWGLRETGWARVSIQAEKRLIPDSLAHLTLVSRQTPGLRRRINGLFQDGWQTALSDAYDVEMRAGRVELSALDMSLADAVSLNLKVLERESAGAFFWSGKAIAADLGMGIFLDVAFQIGNDWNNPYLTTSQFVGRTAVAGVGGGVSGLAGLSTSAILIYAGVASGPAGWIGLGVGLGIDWLWGSYVTPWVYEYFGLNPQRNLYPMGTNNHDSFTG